MMTFVLMVGLQEPATDSSRADAVERARIEKAAHLQQPTRTFFERALTQFKERRVMERFYEGFHGFHPMIGGIRSGSGLGGGTYVETHGFCSSSLLFANLYMRY